ncbi:hypothetical protein AY555_01115 [Haematospirillum jordaniae]|uniref:Uncharacterized protein n=1 Tax=Haematospirillum jordaniae TaxID=1549855 RepID=A0A143DBA9_9PROT|nr:hypothetical protein AY555_01115 [Haematospirillum jordaniae]
MVKALSSAVMAELYLFQARGGSFQLLSMGSRYIQAVRRQPGENSPLRTPRPPSLRQALFGRVIVVTSIYSKCILICVNILRFLANRGRGACAVGGTPYRPFLPGAICKKKACLCPVRTLLTGTQNSLL